MECTNVACPVWPDAQELRMLRALMREGIASVAVSRHGLYAARFHGWRLRLWRFDNLPMHSMHVEIRYPNGSMWARFAWQTVRHSGDEVV